MALRWDSLCSRPQEDRALAGSAAADDEVEGACLDYGSILLRFQEYVAQQLSLRLRRILAEGIGEAPDHGQEDAE